MINKQLEKYINGEVYTLADLVRLKKEIMKSESETKGKELAIIEKFIRDIPDNDQQKKEQQKVEAKQRVSRIVRELIGDRSIRRTAEDTGVAASYITGILKQRYLPSAGILRKLAVPESKPQNGVLIEDLMIAAGYQTQYDEDTAINVMLEELKKQKQGKDIQPDEAMFRRALKYQSEISKNSKVFDNSEESRRLRRRNIQKEKDRFQKISKGIIYQELLENGFDFKIVEELISIRGFRPDIVIKLENKFIDEWWFEFRYIETGDESNVMWNSSLRARRILERYIFVKPEKNRKISIVINSVNVFEQLKTYKDKLSYRGELSIILIDIDKYSMEQEIYLSHYEPDSIKSEFKLK